MDSKELLKSITQSFYEDDKEFITYLSLSQFLMNSYRNILDEDTIIVDLKEEETPLAPFLQIINQYKPAKNIIKNNTYVLQSETFESFFKNGFAEERHDPVIFEEIDYERIRIREAVIALLKKYSSKKVVVFNTQLISIDALRILKEFETQVESGKFIFCFNSLEMDNLPVEIRSFAHAVVNRSNYYSIDSLEDIDETSYEVEEEKEYEFKTLYRRLISYRMFFDIERACRIISKLDSTNALLNFGVQEARKISLEMGLITFYNGESDLASIYLSNVTEHQFDDELDCVAMYAMANVASRKNMQSVALRYINKALVKSKGFDNSPVYALATMMDYIITERNDSQYSTDKYFNALGLLDKFGFTNNRIYTSLVIPYGIIYRKELRQQMLVQVQKSKDDAEKLGNKFGLSTACHWMGIMMTHEGEKEHALSWYQKCFDLRREIGDLASIVKVTNGLSYEYLIDTKYRISFNLINDVLETLMDSKDYPEVVITLYNIARTCFFSRNLSLAYELFQSILNLMSIFEISDLSVNSFLPEYNDIIAYKATIDFFNGEFTRAKMNLHNVFNNGRPFTPIEEVIKFFLNACIELEENNKEKAMKVFEDCVATFFNIGLSQEHRIVFMFYEFANILDIKGYSQDSKEILRRGFEIAKSKDLIYFTQGKDEITLESYFKGIDEFPSLKVGLRQLEEKAEKEKLVNQLHKRLRDAQFLNKLSNGHVNNTNDLRFTNNAVQAIFDYTMADAVFLAEKVEGKWNILANSLRDTTDAPDSKDWERLSENKKSIEIRKVSGEEERVMLCINLSKFEFIGGIIVFLQKKNQISPEELNILNIASSSIQAQLVMLKQNEHLTIISSTDQLSMLNNRRALQEHLGVESEMIRRYEKKRHLYMHEAISFIDLDNFKYYNDTFGHEAGDLLISCFAKLLKRIYRKVDFVARFGGDEFVIVLPNTTCPEAARAAERLQEALEKENFFISELEELVGKALDIPADKHLGFSMGICSNADSEDISDLETAMVNADKALYYSKQHKKGTVTIWTEIKDSFEDEKLLESKS